jgi:hypothetical protein
MASYTVAELASPPDLTQISASPTSSGGCDGSISFVALGGAPPFAVVVTVFPGDEVVYAAADVYGSHSLSSLCSGTYRIEVANADGCASSFVQEIAGCPEISLSEGSLCPRVFHPTDCGLSDGSFRFISCGTYGGVEPYSYSWSNGVQSLDNYGLPSGTYTLTVTDAVGCSAVYEYVLSNQSEPQLTPGLVYPSCAGQDNGYIYIVAASGSGGGFDFAWSNGASTMSDYESELTGLAAGEYCVTVTALSNPDCPAVRCFTIENQMGDQPLTIAGSITKTCPEMANGAVYTYVSGGIEPYSYLWSHQSGINPSLTGLAAGSYCLTVTDHCGEEAVSCFEVEEDQSRAFDLDIAAIGHATSAAAADGFIALAASPAGSYSFSWSSNASGSAIQNLPPGDYAVTVHSANGCSISRSYSIINCEDSKGFTAAVMGGYALDPAADIQFQAYWKEEGEEAFAASIPSNVSIRWESLSGAVLGYGPYLTLSHDFPGSFIRAVISDGCKEQSIQRAILRCDSDHLLHQAFVFAQEPPCRGFSDGSIMIQIPNSTGQEITVSLNGAELPIPQQSSQLSGLIAIGGLSKGHYGLNVSIGECDYIFSFYLGERMPEAEFWKLENDVCFYNESCDGMVFDGENAFQEHAVLHWAQSKAHPKCTTPQLCRWEEKGVKTFERKWARAYQYQKMLLAAHSAEYPPNYVANLYSQFLGMNISACRRVRYCKMNLMFVGQAPGVPGVNDNPTAIQPIEGSPCERVFCTLGSFLACGGNQDEVFGGLDNSLLNNCNPAGVNVYHLYTQHDWAMDNLPGYAGSDVMDFILANGERPEAKCGHVVFCRRNNGYTYISDNLSFVECFREVTDCINNSVEVIGVTCEPAPNGIGYLCYANNVNPNRCSPPLIIPPPSPIPLQESAFTGAMPQYIIDTIQHEELAGFGFAQSEEAVNPKGLLKTGSGYRYYNYMLNQGQVAKADFSPATHFIEDWDTERVLYSEFAAGYNTIRLVLEDSAQIWEKVLQATDTLQVLHLSMSGDEILVGGIVSGELRLEGDPVGIALPPSCFILRLSAQGSLLGSKFISRMALEKGVAFSEQKGREVLLFGAYQDGSLFLDGASLDMGAPEGLFVLKYGADDEAAIVADIIGGAEMDILSISASQDLGSPDYALAVCGSGELWLGGQQVCSGQDSLFILSLSSMGHINWIQAMASEHLDCGKFAIAYGDEKVYLGLTYRDSATILGQSFYSTGGSDILLAAVAADGALDWHETYGTTEDENVSCLLYNQGTLFFGGEFSGSVGQKVIGAYEFNNLVPAIQRAYISYALPEAGGAELYARASTLPSQHGRSEAERQGGAKSASFEDIKIEAFPNPAGETLYVRIHGGAASYKLAVVNAFGQEVAWAEASGTGVAVAIDMSRHPGGLYFVSAANEVGRIVGAVKVVRQ